MKVMLIAGARPNFMKVAPVWRALESAGHDTILVHTGQHYDFQMSGEFFGDLGLPQPDHFLEVGSGSHAAQTARIMERFEPVLLAERPNWAIVPGDVNSTLACALVIAKERESTGTRLAHLEAGLRSHDWTMPEEVNRVLTDRLADLLLLPSDDCIDNLRREGIEEQRMVFVGNVMIDTLFATLSNQNGAGSAWAQLPRNGYAVATLHRPSNVDSAATLTVCLEALNAIAHDLPVVFPMHPRTLASVKRHALEPLLERLQVIEPLGYQRMVSLIDGAAVVLTDSGGLQEETTALGVPCVTLRQVTERPVTVKSGTNRLAPWPLSAQGIRAAFREAAGSGRAERGARCPAGWDGRAAERVVRALEAQS